MKVTKELRDYLNKCADKVDGILGTRGTVKGGAIRDSYILFKFDVAPDVSGKTIMALEDKFAIAFQSRSVTVDWMDDEWFVQVYDWR